MSCQVKRCKNPESYRYLGFWICEYHWILDCEGEFNLKKHFGLPEQEKVVVKKDCVDIRKKEFLSNYV